MVGCAKHNGEHIFDFNPRSGCFETSCGESLTAGPDGGEFAQALRELGRETFRLPSTETKSYKDYQKRKREGKLKLTKPEKKSFGIKGIGALIFALLGMFVILPLPMGIIGIILAWKAIDDGEIVLPLLAGAISMFDIWYGLTTIGTLLDFLA